MTGPTGNAPGSWEIPWKISSLTGTAPSTRPLVVMAQEFKKGQPLVDGHGNFGSIEGVRGGGLCVTQRQGSRRSTQEVYLKDLDKNVVNFVPQF